MHRKTNSSALSSFVFLAVSSPSLSEGFGGGFTDRDSGGGVTDRDAGGGATMGEAGGGVTTGEAGGGVVVEGEGGFDCASSNVWLPLESDSFDD